MAKERRRRRRGLSCFRTRPRWRQRIHHQTRERPTRQSNCSRYHRMPSSAQLQPTRRRCSPTRRCRRHLDSRWSRFVCLSRRRQRARWRRETRARPRRRINRSRRRQSLSSARFLRTRLRRCSTKRCRRHPDCRSSRFASLARPRQWWRKRSSRLKRARRRSRSDHLQRRRTPSGAHFLSMRPQCLPTRRQRRLLADCCCRCSCNARR